MSEIGSAAVLRHGAGLQRKLLYSHLGVAAIGLVVLLVTLAAMLWLRTDTLRLVELRAPTAHNSSLALSGVTRSLAALRGWVTLSEGAFREERAMAWHKQILPAIAELERLSPNWTNPENSVNLVELGALLAQLEAVQGRIEAIASKVENEPARQLFVRDIEPLAGDLFSTISAMIDIEKERNSGLEARQSKALFGGMADFRGNFTRSHLLLGEIVDVGVDAKVSAYNEALRIASLSLTLLEGNQGGLNAVQLAYLETLQKAFQAFIRLAEEALALRQSEHWNEARYLLTNEAVPIAQRVEALLTTMSENQALLVFADGERVMQLSHRIMGLVAVLVILMAVFAIYLSKRAAHRITQPIARLAQATRQLASGQLSEDLVVQGDDELASLTRAFNHMRSSLQQGEVALQSKAQHLARSNRELDQLAYVASHDLKAPLRAIANLSCWVEEDLEESLTPDTRKHMDMLRGRVHRLEALIEGIFQYSRVGRFAVDVEAVDIDVLLSEVLGTLVLPKGFSVEISPNMPQFNAAQLRLSQVFANLIGNAIKYRERDEGQVVVSVEEEGEFYRFSVADDGPGIDVAFHDKVFQIFQTLQARDTLESTGIGLTLVKKIVEEQGGEITLESTFGQGATFCFTWPKQPPALLSRQQNYAA